MSEQSRERDVLDLLVDGGLAFVDELLAREGLVRGLGHEGELPLDLLEGLEDDPAEHLLALARRPARGRGRRRDARRRHPDGSRGHGGPRDMVGGGGGGGGR